ncbi:MAG: MHYT domain-containing protein [Ottowia sp.]|uniref:MHYT domain-containing protein n=1 Tax=unclassified Ottowia TaxID=2645081 RepID=UPI003C2E29C3
MSETAQAGELLNTSYEVSLVLLSYILATVGSFVALTAARRIRYGNNGISLFNLLAASTALGGIGVWSMHFTGMLALKLGMASGYSMVETVVSLVAAIGATAAALAYVAKDPGSPRRILTAGILLGLGVAVMHYLGMYGMRFPGFIVWSWEIVALSVVIAMAAASAALWLAFRTRALSLRMVAAAVMGVAVCAMHYTGMAAADFVCTSPPTERFATLNGFLVISAMNLPALTGIFAVGMILVIAYEQWLEKAFTGHRPT